MRNNPVVLVDPSGEDYADFDPISLAFMGIIIVAFWVTGTDMYMIVEYNGVSVEYYFETV